MYCYFAKNISYYLLILKSSKFILDCVVLCVRIWNCIKARISETFYYPSQHILFSALDDVAFCLNHITLHNKSSIFHLKLIFVTCFISDLIYNHHHLCNFIPTKIVWIKEELNKDLFGFLNGFEWLFGKQR